MTTDPTPESARALLYRHGLPEDVIDGVLCLHAQELAALQRLRMDELDLTGQKARIVGRIVDLIDPTRTAPAGLGVSATPSHTDLRDRIRRAICEAEGFAWDSDTLEPDEYGDVADAVLAVLPPPVYAGRPDNGQTARADLLNTFAEWLFTTGRGSRAAADAILAKHRAEVLHEAADRYAKLADQNETYDREQGDLDAEARLQHGTVRDVVAGLRRLADEATQPEPPVHGESVAHLAGLHDGHDQWADDEQPVVPVHAVPLPGSNGISACCGRPPCEFVGERVTRDPEEVTCTGPAVDARQDGAQR